MTNSARDRRQSKSDNPKSLFTQIVHYTDKALMHLSYTPFAQNTGPHARSHASRSNASGDLTPSVTLKHDYQREFQGSRSPNDSLNNYMPDLSFIRQTRLPHGRIIMLALFLWNPLHDPHLDHLVAALNGRDPPQREFLGVPSKPRR